jgi:hypothetical protein
MIEAMILDIQNLYVNQTKSAGGFGIKATQNMPFELITPMYRTLLLREQILHGELRTTTGKISGMKFLILIMDLNLLFSINQIT